MFFDVLIVVYLVVISLSFGVDSNVFYRLLFLFVELRDLKGFFGLSRGLIFYFIVVIVFNFFS